MEKKKIAKGYYKESYGRRGDGFRKNCIIWLINGKLYARDKQTSEGTFMQMDPELDGYVRVNKVLNEFKEVHTDAEHKYYLN